MVDVNGTVYHLRIDMCTMGKRLMLFCMAPQWGSNSKAVEFIKEMFLKLFQAPQWGSNSKVPIFQVGCAKQSCFSPRNGEVILKLV